MNEAIWPLAAAGIGTLVAFAADQGWLGFRLWSRPRAVGAGLAATTAVVSVGPGFAAWIRVDGWMMVAVTLVLLAVLAQGLWRWARFRYPAVSILAIIGMVLWIMAPTTQTWLTTILVLVVGFAIVRAMIRRQGYL